MKIIFSLIFFLFNFSNTFAENKIAYIDLNHILNNSIVGQTITKHIKEIREKNNKEFLIIEKQLTAREEDIIKKKNILDENEFNKLVDLLKKDVNEYNLKKKKINIEIDNKKIKYTKVVLNTLNPIISKYVEENSITIVFPKKNIIIAKKNLDITSSIMSILNNQLKNIDF